MGFFTCKWTNLSLAGLGQLTVLFKLEFYILTQYFSPSATGLLYTRICNKGTSCIIIFIITVTIYGRFHLTWPPPPAWTLTLYQCFSSRRWAPLKPQRGRGPRDSCPPCTALLWAWTATLSASPLRTWTAATNTTTAMDLWPFTAHLCWAIAGHPSPTAHHLCAPPLAHQLFGRPTTIPPCPHWLCTALSLLSTMNPAHTHPGLSPKPTALMPAGRSTDTDPWVETVSRIKGVLWFNKAQCKQ